MENLQGVKMNNYKNIIHVLICSLLLISSTFIFAQTKKEQAILELLQDMGIATEMYMMIESMEDIFTVYLENEGLDEEFIDGFIEELRSEESLNILMELAVPIYDKYFTSNEIAALSRFFRSPVGKKYVSSTPILTLEMERIGEEWGNAIVVNYLNNN